jgi:hypothetical protein
MLIVCAAARLNAQGYAKIVGTVTDTSGAVIPSATVTATQTQTGTATTVTSGADGAYVFPALLPSDYTIKVSAKDFENYSQTGIVLLADQSVTINIKMAVGSSAVTVSVIGDAPQVDTTSGTLSQVIDEARVVDLPLNGRNAASLITLVAGVTDSTNEGNGTNQGNGKTFPAAVITSANGTLTNQSNYLLDGGNNVDEMTNVNGPFPFPDALQEFSVQTSNYNAEFGQSAGAAVNLVIKSGTEKFHGDLFEFARNGYFDARPYFATVADSLHRHQYGGTIGGPVIIPHFSKGKTTQFFFGYQHTLLHQNSNASTVTAPTLAEEGLSSSGAPTASASYANLCTGTSSVTTSGVASAYNIGFSSGICTYLSANSGPGPLVGTEDIAAQVTNPFTNVPYQNNVIPASDFNTASLAFEKAFPTYTGTEAAGAIGGPLNIFKPTIQSYNEYVSRVDHQFGEKDHLFGHYYNNYFLQSAIYNPTDLYTYSSYFNTRYQSALLSESHSFTSNLLNNLIVNYQREVALRGGPPGSQDITAFGVNVWQPNTGPYMAVSVSGYIGEGSSAFAAWGRNNYTFNDDIHWVKGKHNVAFGGHIELSKFDVTNVYQSYGSFATGGNITNKIGSKTYEYPNAMANFLLGFVTSFSQGNFEQVNDRNHFPGIYAEDSWKVSNKLTLDYGVRWEDFAPWANRNSSEQEFVPSNYVAGISTPRFSTLPPGMMLDGDPGIAKNGVNSKFLQFMPRLGFAYDVFGSGKTVLRGGTGIFYQDRLPGFFNLSQASFVPNNESVSYSNGAMYAGGAVTPGGPWNDPYCAQTAFCSAGKIANPFPYTLPFPSTQTFPNGITLVEYDPTGNFQVPVTYDYNVTIEHQFAPSWAARVAYVGSGSRHQFVNLELNPEVNNGVSGSANNRRVYNTSPVVGPCTTTVGCKANYSDIIEAAMIGSAKFNSLQASLEKKMANGLSLLLNYTWSKSLDDMPQATRVSNTEDLNAGESYVFPLYPSNAANMPLASQVLDIKALDRGRSDIDKPQAISFSYVYALPKLHNGNSVLRYIANGWRTSGLIQHHSGDALTAYYGSDNSLTGLSQDRDQEDFTKPAYLKTVGYGQGDCKTAGKSCVAWLNPGAFSQPQQAGAGTGFGNVVKGSLRGPGYTNWDAAMIRAFPVFHESDFEFRAEYFDLLNHNDLGNPSVTAPLSSSTSFGTITGSQGGPRIAQFSLKYIF